MVGSLVDAKPLFGFILLMHIASLGLIFFKYKIVSVAWKKAALSFVLRLCIGDNCRSNNGKFSSIICRELKLNAGNVAYLEHHS